MDEKNQRYVNIIEDTCATKTELLVLLLLSTMVNGSKQTIKKSVEVRCRNLFLQFKKQKSKTVW